MSIYNKILLRLSAIFSNEKDLILEFRDKIKINHSSNLLELEHIFLSYKNNNDYISIIFYICDNVLDVFMFKNDQICNRDIFKKSWNYVTLETIGFFSLFLDYFEDKFYQIINYINYINEKIIV